ncbi:protein phosphatase 2C domain-containing protein [Streptomyces lincolnensis]|uniref:protein phosphatase 2C domain-containing protein n=1 Tax=Streptomyces lincolnensis TaxID=1915 RepID=UPI001E59952C|nr:protein phosphatase 2C domain-containing protein [Streptomyces lincolnensis]MCD7437057.1 protein phosphatase 2C domain-containing protein [Streptomyces lincolnensis]
MSQQGGTPTGHEDDWWGQLYDDSTEDTGPTATPESLDDRFASAAGAVEGRDAVPPERAGAAGAPEGRVPAPRDGAAEEADGSEAPARDGWQRARAPWEPPPEAPQGPATFPLGPKPPGFAEYTPPGRAPSATDNSVEEAPATAVPASPMPPDTPPPPSTPPPPPPPFGPPRPTTPPTRQHRSPTADTPDDYGLQGDAHGPQDRKTAPDPPAPRDATPDTSRDRPPRAADTGSPPGRPPGAARSAGPQDAEVAPDPYGPQDASTGSPPGRPAEPPQDAEAGPDPHGPRDAAPGSVEGGSRRAAPPAGPQDVRTPTRLDVPVLATDPVDYVGSGPPTYEAEPTALPPADPDDLDDLVADTVLDGARYGVCTLRAVSVRGDSARFRGEPRRDSLLTARFGSGESALVLVAMATGARATPGAHRAAAEACHWIGRAVGRSHARLAEDIRAGRRGDLKSGLHRLTDRSLGKLRASAAEQGVDPEEYAATLRCLLLPADPECRTRVFFGVGAGGLFRLRDDEWHDIEPRVTDVSGEPVVGFGSLPAETPEGDRLTMDLGIPTPPSPYEPAPEPPREPFRFRASIARPGDTLLMCTGGLAEPLRGEPELCEYLTGRWSGPTPPGLAAFLADTQVRVKGYADDRTAAAVWEA